MTYLYCTHCCVLINYIIIIKDFQRLQSIWERFPPHYYIPENVLFRKPFESLFDPETKAAVDLDAFRMVWVVDGEAIAEERVKCAEAAIRKCIELLRGRCQQVGPIIFH